jgi:hypothetical protein
MSEETKILKLFMAYNSVCEALRLIQTERDIIDVNLINDKLLNVRDLLAYVIKRLVERKLKSNL